MLKPRPNYGISRIDQPDKKNHGFYVRITYRGKSFQKYFPDKSSGGRAAALVKAKEYRDKVVRSLPKERREALAKPKRRIKKSGVIGVTHVVAKAPVTNKIYHYWQAAWEDETGRRRTKKFSIARYGENQALDLAQKARSSATRSPKPKAPGKKRKA
jgi:hypothetical protein